MQNENNLTTARITGGRADTGAQADALKTILGQQDANSAIKSLSSQNDDILHKLTGGIF